MECLHKEDEQHEQESRCQHFAHAIDDLVRIQREIVGRCEEDCCVDELPECKIVLGEEGADADLERNRARARHGKQRSDDEVEDDKQSRGEHRPRLCAQQRDILTA